MITWTLIISRTTTRSMEKCLKLTIIRWRLNTAKKCSKCWRTASKSNTSKWLAAMSTTLTRNSFPKCARRRSMTTRDCLLSLVSHRKSCRLKLTRAYCMISAETRAEYLTRSVTPKLRRIGRQQRAGTWATAKNSVKKSTEIGLVCVPTAAIRSI